MALKDKTLQENHNSEEHISCLAGVPLIAVLDHIGYRIHTIELDDDSAGRSTAFQVVTLSSSLMMSLSQVCGIGIISFALWKTFGRMLRKSKIDLDGPKKDHWLTGS